jgi:hypothetical protein
MTKMVRYYNSYLMALVEGNYSHFQSHVSIIIKMELKN